jgi:hypothetical protein
VQVKLQRIRNFMRQREGDCPMNKLLLSPLAACALMVAVSACQRAESPSEVAADVAEAQADRQESIADARMDEQRVRSDTAQEIVAGDPDDRGDAIEDRAEARYDTAIAAASGDLEVARQGCESLTGDAQTACKRSADAAYEEKRADAMVQLEAERTRSNQTQKLDN